MTYNNRNMDLERAIHEISMEHARRDLQDQMSAGRIQSEDPYACIDSLFDAYITATGYLAQQSDDYITALLERC